MADNILKRIADRASGRKAMAELHPETLDRKHVLSVRSDAQMPAPYNYLAAVADWEQRVWVRKAVTIIADNLTPLPLYVERDGKPIEAHPLIDLLTTVNDSMTSMDLWRQWTTDQMLGGECGFELVKSQGGKYMELWPRQPHQFSVIPDKGRARYHAVAGYEIDDGQGEPFTLPPDEFLHFKFYNPRNPWRGISVMQAIRMSIAIDAFAQAWEMYLFQNNARPDYVVMTPTGTTQGERDAIEKKLAQKYGGPGNAGKPIVLEEAISDVKTISWPPKDMHGVELRGMSRDEVAGAFGVPDILMGFGNDSYDTEQKRPAAIRALYSLTIKPLVGFRDGTLTEYFQRVGVLAPNEDLRTDTSGVPELKESEEEDWKIDSQRIESGVMTINEYCAEHGIKPKPWGDVWWAPANLVPVVGSQSSVDSSQSSVNSSQKPEARSQNGLRVDPRHNGHSEDVREIAGLLTEAIEVARGLGKDEGGRMNAE